MGAGWSEKTANQECVNIVKGLDPEHWGYPVLQPRATPGLFYD